MNPLSLSWRYFGTREVQLARDWVGEGGIAVHENLYRSRGRRAAHLLAPDDALLLAAARHLGCQAYWIQRTRTVHFDLVGVHLERALVICGVDPALPPARFTATGATPART